MAIRIGELLIKKKKINPDQLQTALRDQSQTGEFLGAILIRLGYVKEEELLEVLAEQFSTQFVHLSKVYVNPQVVKLIPARLAREHNFLPIEMKGGNLLIAVSNPLDMWPMSAVHDILEVSEVKIVLATRKDIEAAIEKHYGSEFEATGGGL